MHYPLRLLLSAPPSVRLQPETFAYVAAVEAQDGQALEPSVVSALDEFVVGCKQDGTWNAIKASCILSGARTLNGALVPLVGAAPTNFNFVSGDYNRKTGLVGNGTPKYLDSNRNNNADPQNSNHNAVFVSTAGSGANSAYMGADAATNSAGTNNFGTVLSAVFARNRTSTPANVTGTLFTGFFGTNRSSSLNYIFRASGISYPVANSSQTPFDGNVRVFASGAGGFPTNARLAFYSIGEALDLALLDARVTTLINAFAAAIPGDPSYANVSLLLHGNGTNGSTTITDSSSNAVTLTRAGTTPPTISTAQSKYGGSSILFLNSGSTSWLDLAANSLFSFPSDFTFECWVYVVTQGTVFGSTIIETAGNFTDGLVLRGDNLQTSWSWSAGGSFINGGSLTLNVWNHLAMSRSGNIIRVFRDGVQQGTATNAITVNPTAGATRIGEGIAATNRAFNGYIDELRITKGVARYTANFTPPNSPFPDL